MWDLILRYDTRNIRLTSQQRPLFPWVTPTPKSLKQICHSSSHQAPGHIFDVSKDPSLKGGLCVEQFYREQWPKIWWVPLEEWDATYDMVMTTSHRHNFIHLNAGFLYLKFTRSHTHIFLLSPLSCDKICPLFMFFEGMLGSQAARAPGTDMNKWTVLHGSMRRVAKQPKQELLHPLSKGLLSKRPQLRLARSCGYAHASPNMHMHANV